MFCSSCGLYYKHIMIVNDDSSVISKWHSSLVDDGRVIIYDRNMFIIVSWCHFNNGFYNFLRSEADDLKIRVNIN